MMGWHGRPRNKRVPAGKNSVEHKVVRFYQLSQKDIHKNGLTYSAVRVQFEMLFRASGCHLLKGHNLDLVFEPQLVDELHGP